MKLLLSSGLCGMTPQQGSIVGGMYFIMVGIMQMVFESGHLRIASETVNATGSPLLPQLCFDYYYTLLALESATLLLSLCLLVTIWTHWHFGILGFVAWLVLFDITLLVVTSLIHLEMQAVGLKQNPLAWSGIVGRLVGDPFWLAFVITYGLEVRKELHRPGVRQREGGAPGAAPGGPALRLKFL